MSAVTTDLLDWYDRNARELPWRARPGANRADPYHVWLSEIMLQQTTVAAVKPYFAAFTTRWPTIEALAAADEAEVLAAWAGLGYYARARNLVKCAHKIVEDYSGVFPSTEAELLKLPGIGAYTAAAIAAIAFGQRAVVVDANVERVVARLTGIDTPLPDARPEIRRATDTITPATRAGDFAQAMMDLGATICRARDAQCSLCPLSTNCLASKTDDPTRYPFKKPKAAKPVRQGKAWWIENGGRVLLVTRPSKGMLGGMRALPDDGWRARADGDGRPPIAGDWVAVGRPVVHTFTHFVLQLQVMRPVSDHLQVAGLDGEWWPVENLSDAGLPTLFAKAAAIGAEEYAQLL